MKNPPAEIIFESERDRFLGLYAQILYKHYPDKPPTLAEIKESWQLYIEDTIKNSLRSEKEFFNPRGLEGREAFKRIKEGYNKANKAMEQVIDLLERSTPNDREKQLNALWNDFIKHTGQLYKQVPGEKVKSPDFKQIMKLAITSSEQPIRNLETAYERGKFKGNDLSDHPIANISGSVGGEFIEMAAEITPLEGEDKELVFKLAEMLGSPLSNAGPKTQQTFAAVLHLWLVRRKERKEELTIHKQERGSYQQNALNTIRECIATLARTRLTFATPTPIVRGKVVLSSAAVLGVVTYHTIGIELPPGGRIDDHWKAISVKLNSFIEIASGEGFIKGSDFKKLNSLDSVKERAELFMGKYLEHEWRLNWNKTPGVVVRRLGVLLESGLGVPANMFMSRPRKEIEKLERALDHLQDTSIIKYFEYGPEYVELMECKRITPEILVKLFDIRVRIEAGNQYLVHYQNFGLKHKAAKALPSIVTELKEYLSGSATSQAVAAQDLNIAKGTISQYLSGRTTPSKKNAEKIRIYLDNKGKSLNLELF